MGVQEAWGNGVSMVDGAIFFWNRRESSKSPTSLATACVCVRAIFCSTNQRFNVPRLR